MGQVKVGGRQIVGREAKGGGGEWQWRRGGWRDSTAIEVSLNLLLLLLLLPTALPWWLLMLTLMSLPVVLCGESY